MGNLFAEESHELVALDTHDCVDKDVMSAFRSMGAVGTTKYLNEVIVVRTVSIREPIKRNHFHIFKHPIAKAKPKMKQENNR